jgi:hypothetical protein
LDWSSEIISIFNFYNNFPIAYTEKRQNDKASHIEQGLLKYIGVNFQSTSPIDGMKIATKQSAISACHPQG